MRCAVHFVVGLGMGFQAQWRGIFHPKDWTGAVLFAVSVLASVMAVGLMVILAMAVAAAAQPDAPTLLKTYCAGCHSPSNHMGGFDVTTREKLIQGGDRGPGIVPGNPEESAIIQRMRHTIQPGMPFNAKPLPAEVIGKIAEWVKQGAPYSGPLVPQTAKTAGDPNHWSFRKPVKAPVPKTKEDSWARNPIDSFLLADWEARNLKHAPGADRRVLLRRVYMDLTGLPPTTAEMHAFLADTRPDAYERTVDQLLASPRYAARWGRHWMDIWRYSDWYGRRPLNDQRFSQRHIWRWRDWIVDSLAEDKPYDQMIREMIAGDEIAPNDPKVLRATGYLARSFHRFNRNVWLQDTVEHIGFGMLGLTLKCARCHDHKYDPIPQVDYYKFRAFFEPYDVRLDRVPGESNVNDDGLARVFDAEPRKGSIEPYFPPIYKDTFRFLRGDETTPDKTPLDPGVPSLFGPVSLKITPIHLSAEAHIPDLRAFVREDYLRGAGQDVVNAETALATARRLVAQAEERMVHGAAAARAETKGIDFATKIAPLLNNRCRSCHGGIGASTIAKGGLMLTSMDAILKGGWKHGPAIVPGDSRSSPMIRFIKGQLSPRMPLGGEPLPNDEIALLERWADEMPPADPVKALDSARKRLALAEKHLASVKLAKPALAARLDADHARYSDPPSANAAELATKALEAERAYARAQAEELSLEANQLLSEHKSAAAKALFERAAKALAQGAESYTPVMEVFPATTSGRRTALANWLTSKDNPLVARVAINHIWLRHFGKPFVRTVTNFGRNGAKPVNQPLLDWLAVDFMEHGYDMRYIHRLMVTSSAYRMSSSGPDSEYFTHMTPRRMEAEELRDSMLYLAGVLDEREGGEEIDETQALKSRRRSLYIRQTPESRSDFLRLFDQPDPTDCYVRTESVMPQQALAVANSPLSLEAAKLLAARLDKASDFVAAAFETITGAPPTAEEAAESRKFLASLPAATARVTLVHALLNHNEFITIR
jgi:hypothetical protein